MIFGNLINDSFFLLSKQLRFYSWHYKRDLDQSQRQELLNILNESHFKKLANKIQSLHQVIADSRQQIGKLLIENCYTGHHRHQLIQLIKSELVDINVRLDTYGRTLLHRTAYNLDVELVKLLIEHNVNLRLRDYAGNTALHIAIQSYRNGALIFDNEPDVVQNLTEIITLLLDADKNQAIRREVCVHDSCKRIKLVEENISGGNDDLTISTKVRSRCDSEKESNDTIVESYPEPRSAIRFVSERHSATREATICRLFGSQHSCKIHSSQSLKHNLMEGKANSPGEIRANESSAHKSVVVSPVKNGQSMMQTNQNFIKSCLLDSGSSSLVELRNAFGRTALHYCVLVVGEKHLDHFVKLLLSYGADPNTIDIRLKTPLYCLVKRPCTSSIRQKCRALQQMLFCGCDDLGLAMDPKKHFSEELYEKLDQNMIAGLQHESKQYQQIEPIFVNSSFKRLPTLKHLARLTLIRQHGRQNGFMLPKDVPFSLNYYINRRILDQTELF